MAENISTDVHKAVSCHNAGCIGIQSFDNNLMRPTAEKRKALERKWSSLRCLILEEVSMVPPSWYNMIMVRSCYGRQRRRGADLSQYDSARNSFGKMPIVIKLGDFLQKKPVN